MGECAKNKCWDDVKGPPVVVDMHSAYGQVGTHPTVLLPHQCLLPHDAPLNPASCILPRSRSGRSRRRKPRPVRPVPKPPLIRSSQELYRGWMDRGLSHEPIDTAQWEGAAHITLLTGGQVSLPAHTAAEFDGETEEARKQRIMSIVVSSSEDDYTDDDYELEDDQLELLDEDGASMLLMMGADLITQTPNSAADEQPSANQAADGDEQPDSNSAADDELNVSVASTVSATSTKASFSSPLGGLELRDLGQLEGPQKWNEYLAYFRSPPPEEPSRAMRRPHSAHPASRRTHRANARQRPSPAMRPASAMQTRRGQQRLSFKPWSKRKVLPKPPWNARLG